MAAATTRPMGIRFAPFCTAVSKKVDFIGCFSFSVASCSLLFLVCVYRSC
jgi:hypothetical protein